MVQTEPTGTEKGAHKRDEARPLRWNSRSHRSSRFSRCLCSLVTAGLVFTETGSQSPLCSYSSLLGCTQTPRPRTCTHEVCGHSASPAAGRRLEPRFCTSCLAGVPCPCCYGDKKVLKFRPVMLPQELNVKSRTHSDTRTSLSPSFYGSCVWLLQ